MFKYFIPFLVSATMVSSFISADEQVESEQAAPVSTQQTEFETRLDKANELAKKGDLNAALMEINGVIEKDSSSARAYKIRSHIYFAQKQYDKALEDANKLIELAPESPIGYTDRAAIYLALENYEKAHQDADHALELKPNSAYGMMLKATIIDCQKKQPKKIPFLIKDSGGKLKK